MSPRDEREAFVVPSAGDTIYVDSLSLDKLWWLRSLIAQENPDDSVRLDISLWKDGVESNNYDFRDFRIPVENDRGLSINELFRRNRMVLQQRLTQGDTVSGVMSFAYFREMARICYLPMLDPHAKGGFARQVSYMGFEGSMLKDLEDNVNMLNAGPVVSDSAAGDSAMVSDTASVTEPARPSFEIRKSLTLDGKKLDYYVVQTPQYFMMGDNRDNSADSRYWGYVSLRNMRAKAFVIYFSFENEDESFSLRNPFTWWRLPFKIRWNRLGKVIHMID